MYFKSYYPDIHAHPGLTDVAECIVV